MIFNESRAGEAPEWREFLRLLKKARPHCPINGLFLVLSTESLIKDSADKIARKASILAQQLDLIQRTLDVRFPGLSAGDQVRPADGLSRVFRQH